jgi:hypothetical protein
MAYSMLEKSSLRERQFGGMEQVPQEHLIVSDRRQLGDHAAIEFERIVWGEVLQPVVL